MDIKNLPIIAIGGKIKMPINKNILIIKDILLLLSFSKYLAILEFSLFDLTKFLESTPYDRLHIKYTTE